MIRRLMSAILFMAIALGVILPLCPKASAAYENTYVNTGNQIEDLIGVAMTQVGYTEGPDNDTKYGDWLGFPNSPWCASFISWCAEQADISPYILARTALANPGSDPGFGIPCYHGSEYTPKRGDLFFKEDFSHVGIVYDVEGDEVLTIEANTNDDGSDEGYTVLLRRRKIAESYFGVPAYLGTGEEHTYVRKSDPGHPHPAYYQCTTCGDLYYTGAPTLHLDCWYCMRCGCSTNVEGYYKVSTSNSRLPVYSEEDSDSAIRGYLDPGELVYIVAGSRYWGHIIYANSVGYVKMQYLAKYIPTPTNITCNAETYYKGDCALITWEAAPTATDYTVTIFRDGAQLLCKNTTGETSFPLDSLIPGSYEVQIEATDGSAMSEAALCTFRVLQTYTLTYEATGGTGGAAAQVKLADTDLVLAAAVPQREGFRFLGWSENLRSNFATWLPGDLWRDNRDATLFAIWQREDAQPVELQILSPAAVNYALLGQQPDTTGLELCLVYSDGTVALIREDFAVAFDSSRTGTHPLTITCKGLSVSYDVRVFACPTSQIDHTWDFGMADVFSIFPVPE